MIKTLTAKEFNLGNDRYIRTRKHLDLFEGLVYLVQKKTKTAQRYTTIDRLPLSFNFLEIVKQFLPNVTMAKLDSFETLHEEIFRHFYREKDDRKTYLAILKETTETLTSAKLDIPMEIKYWIEVPDFV
jgi:rubrerythrin